MNNQQQQMAGFNRPGQRRQRQTSCPEMYVSQLAQLQGQFVNMTRENPLGGQQQTQQIQLSDIDVSNLAQILNLGSLDNFNDVDMMLNSPAGFNTSNLGTPQLSVPRSGSDLDLRTAQHQQQMQMQQQQQQQGGGNQGGPGGIGSNSVDDHFARSLAKFHGKHGGGDFNMNSPGSPKMHQQRNAAAPYPKNRVRRTSSLPQLYNSQMAALDNAIAQAANQGGMPNINMMQDDMNLMPGSGPQSMLDPDSCPEPGQGPVTLLGPTSGSQKALRDRKLPQSFFSPKQASPQSAPVSPDLLNLLGGSTNPLAASMGQMKGLGTLAEIEEQFADPGGIGGQMGRPRGNMGQGMNGGIGRGMGKRPGSMSNPGTPTPVMPPLGGISSTGNLGMNLGGGGGAQQRPRSVAGMQGGSGNYVMPMSNRVTSPDIRNMNNPLIQQQTANQGGFMAGQRNSAPGMQNQQRIGMGGGGGGGGQGGFDMMEQSLQQLNLGATAIPSGQDNPILFDNVSADLNINTMELEALLSSGGLDFGNFSNDMSLLTGGRRQ